MTRRHPRLRSGIHKPKRAGKSIFSSPFPISRALWAKKRAIFQPLTSERAASQSSLLFPKTPISSHHCVIKPAKNYTVVHFLVSTGANHTLSHPTPARVPLLISFPTYWSIFLQDSSDFPTNSDRICPILLIL